MTEIEVLDAVSLVKRLTDGKLTEKDRMLVYRGGLLLATEELMRLHSEEIDVNLEVLTVIRDIFQNLDEYETAVILAHVEAAEDGADFAGGLNWETVDGDPSEPTSS